MSEWVEWVSEWSEWVNKWTEWVSEWVREWWTEWVSELSHSPSVGALGSSTSITACCFFFFGGDESLDDELRFFSTDSATASSCTEHINIIYIYINNIIIIIIIYINNIIIIIINNIIIIYINTNFNIYIKINIIYIYIYIIYININIIIYIYININPPDLEQHMTHHLATSPSSRQCLDVWHILSFRCNWNSGPKYLSLWQNVRWHFKCNYSMREFLIWHVTPQKWSHADILFVNSIVVMATLNGGYAHYCDCGTGSSQHTAPCDTVQ